MLIYRARQTAFFLSILNVLKIVLKNLGIQKSYFHLKGFLKYCVLVFQWISQTVLLQCEHVSSEIPFNCCLVYIWGCFETSLDKIVSLIFDFYICGGGYPHQFDLLIILFEVLPQDFYIRNQWWKKKQIQEIKFTLVSKCLL